MTCQNNNILFIRMGCWNMGGLIKRQHNKMYDPLFLKKIENLDLVFLVETHLGYDTNISNVGQFECHFTEKAITDILVELLF